MKFRVLPFAVVVCGLVLAACGTGVESAKPEGTPAELARDLADLAVELGSFEAMLDRGAGLAYEASSATLTLELGREPTEDESAGITDVFRDVLSEFVTVDLWEEQLTAVYSARFTADELAEMLRFYESPVGRKALELDQQITDEIDDGVGAALESQIESFIQRVDDRLAAEFDLEGGADE